MTFSNVYLTHIAFIGPRKKTASLEFGLGLNLIYGPSNTGKSSVFDAIDFMLGRERVLKEVPQHEGYDQVLLGLKFSDDNQITLFRHIRGGDFKCFEGAHFKEPEDVDPIILRAKSPTKKIGLLSSFILENVGLGGVKLKKNAENKTISLTLRNLLPLVAVNETEIQKEASPYIGTQYTEQTEHKSRLRYFLTGVDDSSLLPSEAEKVRLSRNAREELLQELIIEQEEKITRAFPNNETREVLEEQQEKIEHTLKTESTSLDQSEEQYSLSLTERNTKREELREQQDRLAEISEMLQRFELLNNQYSSDMARLENIREAGSLIAGLPSEKCPLCGRTFSESDEHQHCDGNLDEIVKAAQSEKSKIEGLQKDLREVSDQLNKEFSAIETGIPDTIAELSRLSDKLSELTPEVRAQRNRYAELLQTRVGVEQSLDLFQRLDDLSARKDALEQGAPDKSSAEGNELGLPTKALHILSQKLQSLLKEWGLPNSNAVHFDKETSDFVINGKHRISNGKGYRAISHAAATLGLMRYAEDQSMPHIGFSIVDSPLLAYEKPENEEDDLSDTDVNVGFFDSLSAWETRQIIIFENRKSVPAKYQSGDQITFFTKSKKGRYGFFPVSD